MTETEIAQRVWDRLDDTGADHVRYPIDTLREYLYDGARFYVARTGCQNATTTITANACQLLYDLPCDLIQIERVLWLSDGEYTPLEAVHTRDLDATEGWWQRRTDTRSRAYFAFGLNRIGLWPVSPDGGETYFVHYQQDVPERLSAVPVEDHEMLVNYVIARFLLSEGKTKDAVTEYAVYKSATDAAKRRMKNVDRLWQMGG